MSNADQSAVISPETLVKRFYEEIWNRAEDSVAREILSKNFRFRGSLGPEKTGVDGFLQYSHAIHAALENFTCEIEDLVVSGRKAAARMLFYGTHRGDLFGVAATGLQVAWAGAAFFETDDRQITRLWVLGDVDGVKSQLGASSGSLF